MNIYDVCKEFEKTLKIYLNPRDLVEVPLVYGYAKQEIELHKVWATRYNNVIFLCFYYEKDNEYIFVKIMEDE